VCISLKTFCSPVLASFAHGRCLPCSLVGSRCTDSTIDCFQDIKYTHFQR
jgi:hypothetical protein